MTDRYEELIDDDLAVAAREKIRDATRGEMLAFLRGPVNCHCGELAIAKCPCCKHHICATHLEQAAQTLAEGYGIKPPSQDEEDRIRIAERVGRSRIGSGFDQDSILADRAPTPPSKP